MKRGRVMSLTVIGFGVALLLFAAIYYLFFYVGSGPAIQEPEGNMAVWFGAGLIGIVLVAIGASTYE